MKSVMTMMPTNLRAPESQSGATCVSVFAVVGGVWGKDVRADHRLHPGATA